MADITLMGASFSDVPAVDLPKTGGGTARFTDVTDTTATASDVASGKVFHLADGTQATGTSSGGGGGGSSWKLVGSDEFAVSTTSTSATKIGTIICTDTIFRADKLVWVRVRDKAGKRNGYFYGTDAVFANYNAATGSTTNYSTHMHLTYRGTVPTVYFGSSAYGVYGNTVATPNSLMVYSRYNANYSTTIDGTYSVEVYLLDWPDGVSPFG